MSTLPFFAAAFLQDPKVCLLFGFVLLALLTWYFLDARPKMKRNVGTVLLLGATAFSLVAVLPFKERLKGGIDILGGSAYSLRVLPGTMPDGSPRAVTKENVEQAIKVLQKRLDASGTAEAQISGQGADGILVQMPGVRPEDSAKIRETIQRVAKLELREVHLQTGERDVNGKTLAQRVQDGDEIVPGYRAFPEVLKGVKGVDGKVGKDVVVPILLKDYVALTGNDVAQAFPGMDGMHADEVMINLNGVGEKKMIALTTPMIAGTSRIAIVLDGTVISAPVVNSTPLGGSFSISGLNDPGEPQMLSNALLNPLENGLQIQEERSVSPTLGAAIVQQGIWSGVLGLALTFVFVLVYYRMAGFVALLGLILNTVLLFGVMALFGFTFSLPGIAGLVLTIGVAVDANVLINERLREELALGRTLRTAISNAYEKAFSAILDANMTSLITAVILFWLASSTVKGFAVTLTVGILTSMFSAILATRVFFSWGVDLGILKNLSFLNIIQSHKFDFLGKRSKCLVISIVMMAVSIGAFVMRGERAFGIDFLGGTRVQFLLGKSMKISSEQAEDALKGVNLSKAAFAQDESNPTSGNLLSIRCASVDAEKVTAVMREKFPKLAERVVNADGTGSFKIDANQEVVSPLIGGSMVRDSSLALALGIVGIFLYVAMRFNVAFGVGALLSVVHDCLIAVGLIVLMGRELSLIHVGAILTIAGYSINDTIIIYDRIRETLQERVGDLEQVMNEAINSTLSRTILTSTATLVSVLSLAILGGASLRDFSLVILLGIVIGTYSSIFVASPIVLWWSKRVAAKQKHAESSGSVVA